MAQRRPTDTTTYIYKSGTAPNTRAVVSGKNKVYGFAVDNAGYQQLGACSEFGHDESRTIDPVRGVGFGDQVAELVPGVTEPMTLTVNSTLLYTMNLFQALGYKGGVSGLVRSLKHHRWPFDIRQELVFSEISSTEDLSNVSQVQSPPSMTQPSGGGFLTPTRALLTFFEGCWFNSYSASYTADAALVTQNASITVTDIVDGRSQYGEYIDTGLAPISAGGAGPAKGYSMRFGSEDSSRSFTNTI